MTTGDANSTVGIASSVLERLGELESQVLTMSCRVEVFCLFVLYENDYLISCSDGLS